MMRAAVHSLTSVAALSLRGASTARGGRPLGSNRGGCRSRRCPSGSSSLAVSAVGARAKSDSGDGSGGRGGFGSRPVAAFSSSSASQGQAGSSSERERSSPEKVRAEMEECFDLVARMGRGAVYLGSARVPEDHPHFQAAQELARDVAAALNCTTWSGLGPGLMEAVTRGGQEANKPVAGFMILMEAGGARQASRRHPHLPDEVYRTLSFFSARKHGLVDAGVRRAAADRTAFFALPGGVGTLDEVFEVLALLQLRRMGSEHPVPFVVMNYDGVFDGLLAFLEQDMVRYGSLREGELEQHWKVCRTNAEALAYLDEFYNSR